MFLNLKCVYASVCECVKNSIDLIKLKMKSCVRQAGITTVSQKISNLTLFLSLSLLPAIFTFSEAQNNLKIKTKQKKKLYEIE